MQESPARIEASSDATDVGQIIFFGDSITAGYGLRSKDHAYPALIQSRLDELGIPLQAVNAGESGETTAGGLRRVSWILSQYSSAEIFVLELGGNDGLRGIPVAVIEKNLMDIVGKVKEAKPDIEIIIAGMQIPTNLGSGYVEDFRSVFPAVAERTGSELIPFILDGVGGVRSLNQADGIHPTAKGHEIIAETVWATLEKQLVATP